MDINQAGPSNTGTKRFVVQSSDVIQDMRVNVSEEISQKERFLGDDEIIENVVHNPTTTICWTIHRPKRGWYIRIRAPSFPPGVFIPLTPLPLTSPYHVDASLSFKSRTSPPPPPLDPVQLTHHNDDSTASIHSYPPTPITAARPPSPGPSSSSRAKKPSRNTATQISTFILSPSTTPPTHAPAQLTSSFFSRALSVLRSHAPAHSNSFTLSRLPQPPGTPHTPPPPYASTVPLASASTVPLVQPITTTDSAPNLPHIQTQALPTPTPPLHAPLLTFHDQTPVLTVRSLTGLFEIDRAEERALGVDTSFWVAVGLTYLEFLEERESYLAALSD
ncbi:hypothetical protein K443DRAFT_430070 [Laccaria amethystina LaAM-08-1]|uniref:Uncharacterized protein n=1 Tax=Laccaria amethystina LaAM-08-1 TaxID=1095629 RepID=A0A0C9WI91_9AGAR|nr:hypothetical protein K443DRAFT_430070 [Laccaria amethystina LaAM-08-1]